MRADRAGRAAAVTLAIFRNSAGPAPSRGAWGAVASVRVPALAPIQPPPAVDHGIQICGAIPRGNTMTTPRINSPFLSFAAGFVMRLSRWAGIGGRLGASLSRMSQRPRRYWRRFEVVVDVERLRLPAGAGEERCIAEIEEHLRGSRRLRAPFAHAPKQVGPFG